MNLRRRSYIVILFAALIFVFVILLTTSSSSHHAVIEHDDPEPTRVKVVAHNHRQQQEVEHNNNNENEDEQHNNDHRQQNNDNDKSSETSSSSSSVFPKPRYQEPFGSVTSSANSAPFLPKLKIRHSSSKPQENNNNFIIKQQEIACWDRLGNPQKQIPSWVSPLFSQILPSSTPSDDDVSEIDIESVEYQDLFDAIESHSHASLIGWVPSKFMGPQPPGVKANGQIMIPPTKGRDYKTYLQEYNASWHTVVTDNVVANSFGSKSHPYVFQLGHRNAIAVCIRERIHLHARRCSRVVHRSGTNTKRMMMMTRPILIHSCLCRKCEDRMVAGYFASSSSSSSSNNNNKLSPQILRQPQKSKLLPQGVSPSSVAEFIFLPLSKFLEVPIQTLLKKTIRDDEHKNNRNANNKKKKIDDGSSLKKSSPCLSMLAAPWLVTKEVLPRFDYEGKEHDLDALLPVQADSRNHVIVVIFNAAWVDHLYNWVYSAVKNAQVSSFIVATMDKDSLELCKKLRLPCFDATDYAVFEDDPTLKSSAHTRKVSEAMSWIKPRLATAIIGRGYGFWMIDLDMSWNSSPMKPLLQQQRQSGSQLLHQCDSPARFSINSGFYDAQATLMMFLFFSDTMTFNPEENSDQTAMRLFGRYDHTFALYNECLNKWLFDMKCNYKVPNSVKRVKVKDENNNMKQIETFEWNIPERDPSKFKWVILHATCLSGAMSKIIWLRTMNAWFLDELEEWRRKPTNEVCWMSYNNNMKKVEVSSSLPEILYSKKYPVGKTDDKFLERRH